MTDIELKRETGVILINGEEKEMTVASVMINRNNIPNQLTVIYEYILDAEEKEEITLTPPTEVTICDSVLDGVDRIVKEGAE